MDSSDLSSARLALTAAALAGDSGGLYAIVSKLLGDGLPFERVLFDLLISAERDLGSRWEQGDYLVTEEHAATAAMETVISLLGGAFDQPENGAKIVIATAEGDDHSLPARALSAHLAFLGYRALFLGANVPASDLTEYLESESPEALALSCSMSTHLPGARAMIAASHRARVPVLAGGRGFGTEGQWATALGADAWAGRLEEAADILETWNPDPGRSESLARQPDNEVGRLIDEWPAIVGAARSQMTGAAVLAHKNVRLLAEIGLALDSVIASMLVDDSDLTREMLVWQRNTLPKHGLDVHPEMIEALERSLEGISVRAARVLERAYREI